MRHRPYNQMKTNPTCDEVKKNQSIFERLRRWIRGNPLQSCDWKSTVDSNGDRTIVEHHCHVCWNYRHYSDRSMQWLPGRHPHRQRCWHPIDPGTSDSHVKVRRLP